MLSICDTIVGMACDDSRPIGRAVNASGLAGRNDLIVRSLFDLDVDPNHVHQARAMARTGMDKVRSYSTSGIGAPPKLVKAQKGDVATAT